MRNAEQDALSRRQLELERDLIASGMDPAEAETVAAEEVLGLPAQRRARESMGAARAAAPPVSYGNAATLDNLDGAATELVVEDILGGALSRPAVPQSERVFQDDPTMGMAGQVAAREKAAAENWAARGQYYGDPDPAARGMVSTYNPATGDTGYSVAYPQPEDFPDGIPVGRPGVYGARPDLRRPVIDTATGQPIQGTSKYEKSVAMGPDGPVEVYAPSNEFRRELGEREDRMRTRRLATRAGYDPMTAAEMATSGEPQDLDRLRAEGDAIRDMERDARRQALVRRRMAQTNPLEYMNRDDISDWNRMVAADGMLRRGYRGATPLDVEQAAETAKALREQRLSFGEGFQPRSPQEQEMIQQKIDAQKPVAVRAQEQAARGQLNHPDVLAYADDLVHQNYSSRPGVLGVSSRFTDNEVGLAAERLSQDLGIPVEQALPIVRRIQADRNRNSVASSIVASFYDQ